MPTLYGLEMAKSMNLIEDFKIEDDVIYLKPKHTNEFIKTTDKLTEPRVLEDI